MGGNGVSQTTWFINTRNRRQDFWRNFFVQFDVLIKLLHDSTAQSFNFAALLRFFGCYLNGHNRCNKMCFAICNVLYLGALLAFHQNLDGAIRQFKHLQDGRDTTDLKHVGSFGFIFGGSFLSNQHDAPIGQHGAF